jgi:pimeloyl-ACP methyl ester carboxylesterase
MSESIGAEPVDEGAVEIGERVVRWTAWGDPYGPSVLCQPGLGVPGTRLTRAEVDAIRGAGVELVIVARPGLGGSTPYPHRTIESDADDTIGVADALGLDRFDIVAHSVGTAVGLTVAARSERVRRVVLISPMAPVHSGDADAYIGRRMRELRMWFRFAPVARWWIREAVKDVRRDPADAVRRSIRHMPEIDVVPASDPDAMAVGALDLAELFADGAVALAEYRMMMAQWPIDLSTIRTPVTIWHGDLDRISTIAMGRWLSRRLVGARLEILQGVGHYLTQDINRRIFEDVRLSSSGEEI